MSQRCSADSKIVVCELNLDSLQVTRMKFPEFKYEQINKVQGLPFTVKEIKDQCKEILER